MALQSIKGTKDIFSPESGKWNHIESVIRDVMSVYRYEEIRTPVFESTAVFSRGIGEETDIVGKEMYSFADKGGNELTLRPEMTAPVIRAYLQHNMGAQTKLTKLYYIAPMFRQERPQAGRFRQFHQFGIESIGLESPVCDAEIIAMSAEIYRRLGITYQLKINSIGDTESRNAYKVALQAFLGTVFESLSAESQRRSETNPLRVLDSKAEQDIEATRNAPNIMDYLTAEPKEHFQAVLGMLDSQGIPYVIEPRLVRGLDYYSKTAFEFISTDLGAQDALGGGGRYDGLAEQLGGKPVAAVGFAAGMERLLMVLEKNGYQFPAPALDLYIIGMDDESRSWVFETAAAMRKHGISVEIDYVSRSLKAQMREANKLNAAYVIVVGDQEMKLEKVSLKNMSDGSQEEVDFQSLMNVISAHKSRQQAS
jgi:histidyl-tRNA synthetase